MYAKLLRNAAHVRRFSIRETPTSGWEVLDEHDSQVLKLVVYTDWHRVERALTAFTAETVALRESGWVES